MRVVGWRYTAWQAFNGSINRGVWGGAASGSKESKPKVLFEELYDHAGDDGTGRDSFDAYENEVRIPAPAVP